jgi:anti-sigma factor RsiW
MNCSDIRGLSSNYLDEELPSELNDRIQRHLFKCAACAQELSTLGTAVSALRAAHPSPAPHEAFIQSALETLSEGLNVTTKLPPAPAQLVLGIGRE